MQTTNLRQLLYSQSPEQQLQVPIKQLSQDVKLQQQLVQMKIKLDQKTQDYLQSEETVLALKKQIKELELSNRDLVSKQKNHDQQLQEMESQLKIATEDSTEYRQKLEKLELMKFDSGEKIDDLTAKLLEWQQNYSILYNNFKQRVDEEVQEVVKNHQQQMDEAELIRQQMNQMYNEQIEGLNKQINDLQVENRELVNQKQSHQIQIQDLETQIANNNELLTQAYQLFKNSDDNTQITSKDIVTEQQERILDYKKKLQAIDDKVLLEDKKLADINLHLIRIQKLCSKLEQVFKNNFSDSKLSGGKTVAVLQEQLTQKQIENIQLNQEIKQLKIQLNQYLLVQQSVQSQVNRSQRLTTQSTGLNQIINQFPSVYSSRMEVK